MVPVWRKHDVCEGASDWLFETSMTKINKLKGFPQESSGHVSETTSENLCLYILYKLSSLTNASCK